MDNSNPKPDAPRKRRQIEDSDSEDLLTIMERVGKKLFPDAEASTALAVDSMPDARHKAPSASGLVALVPRDASLESLGAVIARMERPPASTE